MENITLMFISTTTLLILPQIRASITTSARKQKTKQISQLFSFTFEHPSFLVGVVRLLIMFIAYFKKTVQKLQEYWTPVIIRQFIPFSFVEDFRSV